MPIFQTLTNYFTGSVDARAKFLVAETTIGAVSGYGHLEALIVLSQK